MPPPPPQGYFFASTNPSTANYMPPPPQFYSNGYTTAPNSMVPRLHHQPFYTNNNQHDVNVRPPPPYVDHQTAKKVRNDVNLHKHTLRLDLDPHNPDHHLISFVFDALYDGRSVNLPD